MKIFISICVALCLFPSVIASAGFQDKAKLQQDIERSLKTNEPEWHCKKIIPEGELPAGARDVSYRFECRYKDQEKTQVRGYIYVLLSREEAVKMLDRSQMMLQVNASKPQYGIGEQAYGYAGPGVAWITFRKGNVFAQVNVSVGLRSVIEAQLDVQDVTIQAFEIAKRFAFYLAQYTADN